MARLKFCSQSLEGGKINNETTGKTEQLPSIAGAEYVSLKICQYLTDTDVQKVAEKALTKS